jgi:membrane-bound lytic murein transglycosylase MltF
MKRFAAAFLVLAALAAPAAAQQRKPVALPTQSVRTGDLDTILTERAFRLIVPYSKTHFFIDKGRELGVAAEFGREFETWLNKRRAKKGLPIRVVFVPTPRDKLFSALLSGRGDAVAANLTITEKREEIVDFAQPWLTGVDEILVTGPAAPIKPATLDDLAGRELPVREGTSYIEHIAAINADFAKRGLAPIKVVKLSARLQTEDVLQMVGAGLLPWAVADSHIAGFWTRADAKLTARPDIVFNAGGEIAWAIRPDSPLLKAELDEFFAARKQGTAFGATILRRYYGGRATVRNAAAAADSARFEAMVESFRRHGDVNNFDYLLLAAQGYQESRLDQKQVSPRGAVGIMQLLPSTAAAAPIGIKGVAHDPDLNIKAGAAVMALLRKRYVNDPELDDVDRTLLTFAAYNAGPGNLRKFRRRATQMGLDPNVWFDNVEVAAARIVGPETVHYVGNIYKYYVAYRLASQQGEERLGRAPRPAPAAAN